MIREAKNAKINNDLRAAYQSATESFLAAWSYAFTYETPPCRINEFGIIDEARYDTDEGVLFVGKETNNWRDQDYENGTLFRSWMETITRRGLAGGDHISQHPNMWYNIGRWATLVYDSDAALDEVANMKASAISAIGRIAFTNINKVRGKESSRQEYNQLAKTSIAKELLRREVEIIQPKFIICCGTYHTVVQALPGYNGNLIRMPHPGSRKKTATMLEDLNKQLILEKENGRID